MMYNAKDILVVTTHTIEGRPIKRHLKPVTAHVVAGTNVFSDVFASFTDVFGGRSQTYQSQLSSLYDEAIEKIKTAAYELGANCVVGLSIDMDEISGKGKSMFMLTAIGTAVIAEENQVNLSTKKEVERFENVSADRIKVLQQKGQIIKQATDGSLQLSEEIWNFITNHRIGELLSFLLKKYKASTMEVSSDSSRQFRQKLLEYLSAFPDERRAELLYTALLTEDDQDFSMSLASLVKDLQLLNLDYVKELIHHKDFLKNKRGMQILAYDKPYFNKEDLLKME